MANTGAHLTDHILPDVPIRQWVLSVPFDVGALMARDARLLSAVLRIFVDVVSKWHKGNAAVRSREDAKPGAVSFVQRFGSALNLHVHFHLLVLDGVYEDGESLSFRPSPAPNASDLRSLTMGILRRVRTLLKRRGLIGEAKSAPENPSAERGVTEQNVAPGFFADIDDEGRMVSSPPPPWRKTTSSAAETCGFSLDASVRIAAGDFQGRERLCRYGARHPFSAERISETTDGRIAYKMKKPRQGKRFLVMTPLSFLRRLAFLVPPPFYPLVRYHGVLAPNSKWRSRIVRVNTGPKASGKPFERCAEPSPLLAPASEPSPNSEIPPVPAATTTPVASQSPIAPAAISALASTLLAATTSRLSRLEWATLLRRIYDVDALKCPRCNGRLDLIAVLTDPIPIREILDHLGLPSAPPVLARARDPTYTNAPTFLDAHP